MINGKAMQKLSYGLYVVTSVQGKSINGQIANTVFQVTSDPATVVVSINKSNLTHEYIKASKVFAVSILCTNTPIDFIGRFGFKSGRDINKFEGVEYKSGTTQAPVIIDYSTAYMEGKVIKELDMGTHTLFVAEVVEADIISAKDCMTYDYYHKVKKGGTPKTAPSYIAADKEKQMEVVSEMPKYRCSVCGYVYDPEEGDPENDIKPGTPFEDIPDDWTCPLCGAQKSEFEIDA